MVACVSAVGSTAAQASGIGSTLTARTASDKAASLQGQIQQAQLQLNDWVTCVSSTTPKGQAAIRSLSAQISAAKEQIQRLQTGQTPASGSASAPSSTGAGVAASQPGATSAAGAGRLDVWA